MPTIDLPLCDTIHNCASSNLTVAQRTASVALKYIYDKMVMGDFSDINKSVKISENKVRLYFDNIINSLSTDYLDVDNTVLQFEDEDGINNIKDIVFNRNNTVDILLERNIMEKSKIGCENLSYSGGVLYDILTRYPILAFDNIETEL